MKAPRTGDVVTVQHHDGYGESDWTYVGRQADGRHAITQPHPTGGLLMAACLRTDIVAVGGVSTRKTRRPRKA